MYMSLALISTYELIFNTSYLNNTLEVKIIIIYLLNIILLNIFFYKICNYYISI